MSQTTIPVFRQLGVALDLGTTTLAAGLYDNDGRLLAEACNWNPQGDFGADVISRVSRSMAGEARALAQAVRRGINELLEDLCQLAGKTTAAIDTLVITGNTAMLYLLTERNCQCLGRTPFRADWLAGEWFTGTDLELICPEARVLLPPCISAFVGADVTTGLLAVDLQDGESPRLFVDIGTNGEMALWNQGRLTCCATAAGPAFEGAGLSMGMQARAGAICHVKGMAKGPDLSEPRAWELQVEVVGDTLPRGICGSGVVDALRCLLDSGRMDETGYLEEEKAVIAGEVTITQQDIRQVQLAKGAIRAGMEVLLEREGLLMADVKELLVAGNFGTYLDPESACRIGLLPDILVKKGRIILCGNTALAGAVRLLLDREALGAARRLAVDASWINLAVNPRFQEKFVECMNF